MLVMATSFHGKETAMEIRVGSQKGLLVGTPSATLEDFVQQTRRRQRDWSERLLQSPDEFADIEEEIDQHFRNGAGHFVAAVLGRVSAQPQMDEHNARVRRESVIPLRSPQQRPLRVRLLCGLLLFITTMYCAPRQVKAARRKQSETQQSGLYPELAALGFGKGCSPALQYKVARAVALNPSFDVARRELAREGIVLDKKTVRRIAEQLGLQLLALRQRELMAWRIGKLPAGSEFAGRRAAVQIDGGRIRLRENKKRKKTKRRTKKKRQTKFSTPWREPKVLTIFEFDTRGKMVKKHCQPLIDGTLLGPDHLAELVAFHLHRLGVAKAELVVFAADGARWIWDRLEWIERRVGLDRSRTVHVLDFCHAAHHISLALMAKGMKETRRKQVYRELRTLLKRSRYDLVVKRLKRLARGQPKDSDMWTKIRYLEKHGREGHLNYATFRRRGIPCGSGAIESTIRRVINLRLKSNAMYWLQENAEGIFAVRAILLCERWEETLSRARKSMARDRRLSWKWDAPENMNVDPQVNLSTTEDVAAEEHACVSA
jgi:hypothetical protein